jgi:hypothetical protein
MTMIDSLKEDGENTELLGRALLAIQCVLEETMKEE